MSVGMITPEIAQAHVTALVPADRTAVGGPYTSSEVDLNGAEILYVKAPHATIGTTLEIAVEHSSVAGSGHVPALDDDGNAITYVAGATHVSPIRIRVRGSRLKRYVQLVATLVGTDLAFSIEAERHGLDRSSESDVDAVDLAV